jgi:hypothetical protein
MFGFSVSYDSITALRHRGCFLTEWSLPWRHRDRQILRQSTEDELRRLDNLLRTNGITIIGSSPASPYPSEDAFKNVGHFMAVPFAGLVGGLLARLFVREREETSRHA